MTHTVASLRSKLQQIATPEQGNSLISRLYCAYHRETVEQLRYIFNQNSANIELLSISLETYLQVNWEQIKGTTLCYTAKPDAEITTLLCEIAEFVVEVKNKDKPKEDYLGVINVLMPGVNTDSSSDDHPDLAPNEYNEYQEIGSILEVLKTHIISDKHNTLIPVSLLEQLNEQPGIPQVANPYYDALNKNHTPDMVYLSELEFNRLTEHSPLTRVLYDAKTQYEAVANDDSNLLGHLRQLITQLQYNSVNGVGQETSAGAGAYVAIHNFMTYFDRLSSEERSKVPSAVNQEIEALRDYASNASNIGAIGSCLATRRSLLQTTLSGNETLLSSIFLNGSDKSRLIEKAKQQLESTREELHNAIESQRYNDGFDKLGLSLALTQNLNLQIGFNQVEDLDVLKPLAAEELYELATNPDIASQITNCIANIETLVTLAQELPAPKLQALLTGLHTELQQSIIQNGSDYSSLLITLDEERRDACFAAGILTPGMLYQSVQSLAGGLKYLAPHQRQAACEQLLQALPELLTTTDRDNRAPVLSIPSQISIYKGLNKRISAMSEDADDFTRELYMSLGRQYARKGLSPLLRRAYLMPFESWKEVALTVGLPALGYAATALLAVVPITLAVSSLINLAHGRFSAAYNNLYWMGVSTAITLVAYAAANFSIIAALPSLAIRSVLTGWYSMFGEARSINDTHETIDEAEIAAMVNV